jgi:hypothetical protein
MRRSGVRILSPAPVFMHLYAIEAHLLDSLNLPILYRLKPERLFLLLEKGPHSGRK